MKTYFTLRLGLFICSCLVFCILISLSSSSPIRKISIGEIEKSGAQLNKVSDIVERRPIKRHARRSLVKAAQSGRDGDTAAVTTNESESNVSATEQTSATSQNTTIKSTNIPPEKIVTAAVVPFLIICICIIVLPVIIIPICYYKCCPKRSDQSSEEDAVSYGDEVTLQKDEHYDDVNNFLEKHNSEYVIVTGLDTVKQRELGSRMQKRWYSEVCERQDSDETTCSSEDHLKKKLLTVCVESQGCPLKLHKDKHIKGLKKLLSCLKEHPYLHPIEHVEVYTHKNEQREEYRLLLMVQPFRESGSLKDMIYEARPLKSWSNKYCHSVNGLPMKTVAQYGRQILEAMKFLYSRGFPTLGHVQTGNIFVVDNVCKLGGYENTLLGYKTRLYRLCKDHADHLDIILFGHVIFEMAAGYELTQLRPTETDYTAVDSEVSAVLEYIFQEGFPHNITEISGQDFFATTDPLPGLEDFDPNKIQLSDAMTAVLKKVRKRGHKGGESDGHRIFSRFKLPKLRTGHKPHVTTKKEKGRRSKV